MNLTKKQLLIIIFFVLTTLFVRFYKLGSLPTGLYWDEMAMYVDVKSIIETGNDMHGNPWHQLIYPSYGDYKLPVYIWFASIGSKLVGLSEFSLRLPSAIAGVVSIVTAFFIARELFNKSSFKNIISSCVAVMVAMSPWSVTFSRTAFEGHLAQAFFALSVLFLLRSKKNSLTTVLAVLFGVVATYTYFSVRFVWPVVFSVIWLYDLEITADFKNSIKSFLAQLLRLLVPLAVYAVLLVPFYQADYFSEMERFRYDTSSLLKHESQIVTSNTYVKAAGNTGLDRMLFHRHLIFLRELSKNYSDHLSLSYIFIYGDENLRHGTGQFGLFLFSTFTFFIFGLFQLFQKEKRVGLVLLVWWLASLLPASIPESTPHALRSLNALLPIAMIIGYGLGSTINFINDFKNKTHVSLSLATLCAVLFLEYSFFAYHYFNVYPQLSASSWQDGFREVSQKLAAVRKDKQKVVVALSDDKFYLWVMGYGLYTGAEYNTWTSSSFIFRDFDAITFGNVTSIVDETNTPYLVVTTEKRLQEAQQLKTLYITEKARVMVNSETVVISEVKK